jgi:hypothetical protein
MAYIVLTHSDDGESQVDIYERRPSYVVIDKSSVMLEVTVDKSRYKNVFQDIQQIASALREQ